MYRLSISPIRTRMGVIGEPQQRTALSNLNTQKKAEPTASRLHRYRTQARPLPPPASVEPSESSKTSEPAERHRANRKQIEQDKWDNGRRFGFSLRTFHDQSIPLNADKLACYDRFVLANRIYIFAQQFPRICSSNARHPNPSFPRSRIGYEHAANSACTNVGMLSKIFVPIDPFTIEFEPLERQIYRLK